MVLGIEKQVKIQGNETVWSGKRLPLQKTPKWEKITIVLVLGGLALGALVWALWPRAPGEYAVITYEQQELARLPLSQYTEETTLALSELGVDRSVYFLIREGKICFVNVDCPDHLCENFGWIGKAGESAVCLPNKVAVRIGE